VSYRDDWASALGDVTAAGTLVTLTPPGGSALAAISGGAVSKRGNPLTYQALDLVESDALTLVFVPATYGVLPSLLGYGVVFAGTAYLVRSSVTTSPDGNTIVATVVCAR